MIGRPHLDVNVVTHCNSRCTSCSHASPFSKPWFMDISQLRNDLGELKKAMYFTRVQLVGGEPTLHPKLVDLMIAAAEAGIADTVSVITNGRLLHRMPEDFWKTTRVLCISKYGNTPVENIELAERKRDEYGFLLEVTPWPEFFQQFKPVPDDGQESFRNCHWKDDCWTVHNGYLYLCPQSIFFTERFLHEDPRENGVAVEGISPELIEALIHREKPLSACSICTGGYHKAAPWKESRNMNEWITDSTID